MARKTTGVHQDPRTGKFYANVKRAGRLHRVPGSFDSATDAQAARDAFIADLVTGKPLPRRREPVAFEAAVAEFLASRYDIEQTSIKTYRLQLKSAVEFFGDRPIDTITALDLEQYRKFLLKPTKRRPRPCAPSTIRTRFVILKLVFRRALERDWIHASPFEGTRLPKAQVAPDRHRALTPEEHDRVVAAASEKFKVMFDVWPDWGLRRAEMLGLRWDDVDLDAGIIHVSHQLLNETGEFKAPKGGKDRYLPLSDEHVKKLRRWRLACPPSSLNLVFPSPHPKTRGSWLRDCALDDVWRRTARKAGVSWAKIHNLRHTFGSWQLVANNGDLALVSRLMGHANVAITARVYVHDLSDNRSREAAHNLAAWRNLQRESVK